MQDWWSASTKILHSCSYGFEILTGVNLHRRWHLCLVWSSEHPRYGWEQVSRFALGDNGHAAVVLVQQVLGTWQYADRTNFGTIMMDRARFTTILLRTILTIPPRMFCRFSFQAFPRTRQCSTTVRLETFDLFRRTPTPTVRTSPTTYFRTKNAWEGIQWHHHHQIMFGGCIFQVWPSVL